MAAGREYPDADIPYAVTQVLRALRGPDASEAAFSGLKENTTAVIRYAAFPKLSLRGTLGSYNNASSLPGDTADNLVLGGQHFKSHIEEAAYQLGLIERGDSIVR